MDFSNNFAVTCDGKTYQIVNEKNAESTNTKNASVDLDMLLQNAVKPAGSTLYVWGGGWDAADTKAGEGALRIGILPQWRDYFEKNRNGYSFKPGQNAWKNGDRSIRLNGLDCSGFVGWAVYNSVLKNRNPEGYVTGSTQMASLFAGYGYGSTAESNGSSTFLPGDIVSLSGHVYICLGTCTDKSILLIHSTPNGGVQVSGTWLNGQSSVAAKLAAGFMKKHYTKWWDSFGAENQQTVNASYKNGIKFSWDVSIIFDSGGLRSMSGEELLRYLSRYAAHN